MSYDDEVFEGEVMSENGGEKLPAVRGESMPAAGSPMEAVLQLTDVAHRYQRNEARALQRSMGAVDESSVWAIPNRGEGLSVKIARTALHHYQNAAVFQNHQDAMILNGDGIPVAGWKLTVMVVDMQNLIVQTSSASCAKPQKRHGEKSLAYEQRCFQTLLAFTGRVERNAIFKILPGEWQPKLLAAFRSKQQARPLADRVAACVQWCDANKISKLALKDIYGVQPEAFGESEWADLCGRINAVKGGHSTLDGAFPEHFDPAESRGEGKKPPEQAVGPFTARKTAEAAGLHITEASAALSLMAERGEIEKTALATLTPAELETVIRFALAERARGDAAAELEAPAGQEAEL